MKLVSDFYNKAASFNQNDDGGILPLTALLLTGFMLAGGAAIDYSRYASAKNIMNTALDAAILDAGVRLGEGQPVDQKFEDDFNAFFNVNIAGRGGFGANYTIVDFSADEETGRVNASAAASVETTLMKIGGFDKLDISTEGAGVFGRNETEVTIMLDVTGSMFGTVTGTGIRKIDSLKRAANDAIAGLLPINSQNANTRVGLVPYASSVNASAKYASVVTEGNSSVQIASTDAFANASFNVPTTSCVTGRGGRDASTDIFDVQDAPLGSDSRTVNGDTLNRQRLECPEAEIIPLTSDRELLEDTIDSLVAQNNGFTAGHLGIAWSYYMLSPNWTPLWEAESDPQPYSADVNKFAILMTDGEFNTAYDGVRDNNVATNEILPFGRVVDGNRTRPDPLRRSIERSESISADLCANMRNDGITVYAIAFDAPTSAAALLRSCSSTGSNGQPLFFDARNEDQLSAAFDEIVEDITSLRLTQ